MRLAFLQNTLAEIAAFLTRRFYPRGTQRILRWVFNPKSLKIRARMKYDRDLLINVDTSSYVERELFFRGYYEKWVIDLIKKIIRPGDIAIDAGANIGTHTLIIAKLAGAGGKVFAFDPDPQISARLRENLNLNKFENVKVFPLGLSDKEGKTTLFSYGSEMLDQGTASLYGLPRLRKSGLDVQVSTIDKIVEAGKVSRLDFIKIDTRGSDYPIIRGAEKSVKNFRPFIIFEFNKDNWASSGSKWEEARSFFDGNDYLLYLVSKNGPRLIKDKTDEKTSYNILSVPKEKSSKFSLL